MVRLMNCNLAVLCSFVLFCAPRASCVKGGFQQLCAAPPHDNTVVEMSWL